MHVFCFEGSSVVSDKKKTLELIWNCDIFLQSDADYWLLSDADVSITDMWRTERILSRHLSLHFIHYIYVSYTYTHKHAKREGVWKFHNIFVISLIYLQLELNGMNSKHFRKNIVWFVSKPQPQIMLQIMVKCLLHPTLL